MTFFAPRHRLAWCDRCGRYQECSPAHLCQACEDRPLQPEELDRVASPLRPAIREWMARGEEVPYGVVYVDCSPLTAEEAEWAEELGRRGRA